MSSLKPNQCFGDLKRQLQIEMVLKKINLDAIDITDALLEYNEEILTKDICELLLPITPNESECNEISKISENKDIAELSLCESFILLLSGLPHYKERLESIIFKFTYNNIQSKISSKINDILNGFNFIKKNYYFHKFLDVLLEQTDFIEKKTVQKDWKYGILISSLPKIYDMKAKDNKTNILQYAIETLLKNDLKFFNHFEKNFQKFESFNLNLIKNDITLLDEKFKNVQILKNMVNTEKEIMEDDDKTEIFLLSFYEHANKCLNLLKELTVKINKEYNEVSEYLGLKYVNEENSISLENFIEIMKEFYIKTSKILEKQNENKCEKQCENQFEKKSEKQCEKILIENQFEKKSEKQCEKILIEKQSEKQCEKQCEKQFEKQFERQSEKQSEIQSKKQFEIQSEKQSEIQPTMKISNLSDNEEGIINITFCSTDQNINILLSYNSNTKFYVIEDFIYSKFPQYKETENYFLVNGMKINRFKTLKENKIRNGDQIIIDSIE